MAPQGTLRRLSILALTYTTGDVLVKGLTFILLPAYIRFLPPEQFGIVALTEMLRILLMLVLSLGMSSAALRFVHLVDRSGEERHFFGAMWSFMIVVPGFITGVLLLIGSWTPFSSLLGIPFQPYVFDTILTAYLNTAFILLPWTLFKARDKAKSYTSFAVIHAIVVTALTLYHVVVLHDQAAGWVAGQLQAAALMATVSLFLMLGRVRPNLNFRIVWPAITFALPLTPHFFAHWILGVSDRLILERFTDLFTVGWYSLGYQVGQAYQVLITAMNSALIPMFGRAINDQDERELLPTIVTYYSFGLIGLGLAFSLLGPLGIVLLFPDTYSEAAKIVPWVTLGYLAFGFYYVPINYLSITLGQTRRIPLITIAVALLNVTLNIWLIPRYGALAAAVTTAVSYITLMAAMLLIAARSGPIPIETGRVLRIGGAGLATFLGARQLMGSSTITNFIIALSAIAIYPTLVFIIGTWSSTERQAIWTQLQSAIKLGVRNGAPPTQGRTND